MADDAMGDVLRSAAARMRELQTLLDELANLKRYDPNAARGWKSSAITVNVPHTLMHRIDVALGRA
mgnify:CR=1 FL=1